MHHYEKFSTADTKEATIIRYNWPAQGRTAAECEAEYEKYLKTLTDGKGTLQIDVGGKSAPAELMEAVVPNPPQQQGKFYMMAVTWVFRCSLKIQ